MLRLTILVALLLLNGCDKVATNNELSNKSEYSVLQYYEYELRDARHDKGYLLFSNALNTKLTVLAFPIKDKSVGYVAILVNSEAASGVKAMTGVDFVVTEEAYAAVKKEVSLSKEVDKFIAARVQ